MKPAPLFLALPVLVAALVPPALQTPLARSDLTPPPPSPWKSFSHRLIRYIWPPPTPHIHDGDSSAAAKNPSPPSPPAHMWARYGDDIVLRFNITTPEQASGLADAANTLFLDVWEFSHSWVDIRLAKSLLPSLLSLLPPSLQHSHTPLLLERDLTQAVYDTYPAPRRREPDHPTTFPSHLRDRTFSPYLQPPHAGAGADTNIFFSDYQPLSVIQPWMRLLASLFTTHVRLISVGKSYQGRDIPALRVGVHPTNNEDPAPPRRKTILIAGGLHAREWIATSTVNYVAYGLITAYGKNPRVTRLLENFDFVFVPTLNPDGYVYTWETDRLWRKNRQETSVHFCQGIDLDRGFGFEWDGATVIGSAANPCSESFPGAEPFEAVEARRLAGWARNETDANNVDFVGFLDLHSYSQEILYPYSYTCKDAAPGAEDLEELALGLEKAIRRSSGQLYEVMVACEGNLVPSSTKRSTSRRGDDNILLPRIEDAGGSALDWFYHELRVRFAYQIKLRDRGTYGFLLPRENILPTGREILDAVLYFGDFLSEVYEPNRKETVWLEKPTFDEDEGNKADEGQETVQEGNDVASTKEDAAVEVDLVDEDDGWIIVDAESEDPEPQWDLRRRRRR